MDYDLFFILEICVLSALAFWAVGSITLLMAVRKGRSEFRTKGFLKPPSGTRWLRFLLWKQYDYFSSSSTRFFFGISHFCLIGIIIVLTAGVVFSGSELLLKDMNGMSGVGMSTGPKPWLPR